MVCTSLAEHASVHCRRDQHSTGATAPTRPAVVLGMSLALGGTSVPVQGGVLRNCGSCQVQLRRVVHTDTAWRYSTCGSPIAATGSR